MEYGPSVGIIKRKMRKFNLIIKRLFVYVCLCAREPLFYIYFADGLLYELISLVVFDVNGIFVG